MDAALALLAADPAISFEGTPTDWLTARVRKAGVPPRPERPERCLTGAEEAKARALLAALDEAFARFDKPNPLTDLAHSYMPLDSHAFDRVDWDSADYSDYSITHEGWICAPLPSKLWLMPRLLRILLLRRDHPAVDNISIDVDGLMADWGTLAPCLTASQAKTLREAMAFYDSLFQTREVQRRSDRGRGRDSSGATARKPRPLF